MVSLGPQDLQILLSILVPLPILSKERGREAVLIGAGLQGLLPQLELDGPPAVAIPLMVHFLQSYGRLDYEQEALGRFLNAVKDHAGVESRATIEGLVDRYRLMVPSSSPRAVGRWQVPATPEEVREKIIGENTLRPIAFIQLALMASRSVAYVEVRPLNRPPWSGTGFLIAPDILLTNHHVLPDPTLAGRSTFRFNYQLGPGGAPELAADFQALDGGVFHADEQLDYAVVQLAGDPAAIWGHVRLRSGVVMRDSRVNIIQHPHGLPKQISLQNNFVQFANARIIQYVTSTQPGSSGAPVFDDDWSVVGVHHGGGWLPEQENGPLHYRNEATTIGAILEDLPGPIRDRLSV